jgi:hypothetical protein
LQQLSRAHLGDIEPPRRRIEALIVESIGATAERKITDSIEQPVERGLRVPFKTVRFGAGGACRGRGQQQDSEPTEALQAGTLPGPETALIQSMVGFHPQHLPLKRFSP